MAPAPARRLYFSGRLSAPGHRRGQHIQEQASEFYIHEVYYPSPAEEESASPIAHLVQQILDEVAQQEHLQDRQTIYIIDPEGQKTLRAAWKSFIWLAKIFYGRVTLKIDVKKFTCAICWQSERLSLRSDSVKLVIMDLLTSCDALSIEPGEEGRICISAAIPLFLRLGSED